MAELIHKQDIYDAVDLLMTRFPYKVPGRPDTYHPYNEAWHDACSHVLDVIRYFSPADVAPVVRCRDCMYNGSCLLQSFVEDNCVTPIDRANWFCADGKKRGDADGSAED